LCVQRIAEAGIGIDDEGNGDAFADVRDRLCHFTQGRKADIGAPNAAVGNAGTAKIGARETSLFDQQCG
jgi:hypothetical protein